MQKQGLGSDQPDQLLRRRNLLLLDPSEISSPAVKLNLHYVPHHLVTAVRITWLPRVSVTKLYLCSLWYLKNCSCVVHGTVAVRSHFSGWLTLEEYVLETCIQRHRWKRPCQDEWVWKCLRHYCSGKFALSLLLKTHCYAPSRKG